MRHARNRSNVFQLETILSPVVASSLKFFTPVLAFKFFAARSLRSLGLYSQALSCALELE